MCEEDACQEIKRESNVGRKEVTHQVLGTDNSSFGSWVHIRVLEGSFSHSPERESRRRKADAFISLGTLPAPHKHSVSYQYR